MLSVTTHAHSNGPACGAIMCLGNVGGLSWQLGEWGVCDGHSWLVCGCMIQVVRAVTAGAGPAIEHGRVGGLLLACFGGQAVQQRQVLWGACP
jgi:hypothetical protein